MINSSGPFDHLTFFLSSFYLIKFLIQTESKKNIQKTGTTPANKEPCQPHALDLSLIRPS